MAKPVFILIMGMLAVFSVRAQDSPIRSIFLFSAGATGPGHSELNDWLRTQGERQRYRQYITYKAAIMFGNEFFLHGLQVEGYATGHFSSYLLRVNVGYVGGIHWQFGVTHILLTGSIGYSSASINFWGNTPGFLACLNSYPEISYLRQNAMVLNPSIKILWTWKQGSAATVGIDAGVRWYGLNGDWRYGYGQPCPRSTGPNPSARFVSQPVYGIPDPSPVDVYFTVVVGGIFR